MKKIIVAIAAAVIGIAANAASINWSMSSVANSPASTVAAGWKAYIMAADTLDAFVAATDKASYVLQNYVADGAVTVSRGKATVGIKEGNYSASQSVSGYMVIFDNSNAASANYYAYTNVGGATISAGGADDSVNFGTFSAATATTGGWTAAAAPEPTSGLLLLIGMAGLALRRKQA